MSDCLYELTLDSFIQSICSNTLNHSGAKQVHESFMSELLMLTYNPFIQLQGKKQIFINESMNHLLN